MDRDEIARCNSDELAVHRIILVVLAGIQVGCIVIWLWS